MTWTNCGNKTVRKMFDRDRIEQDSRYTYCNKCKQSIKGLWTRCPCCGTIIKKVNK